MTDDKLDALAEMYGERLHAAFPHGFGGVALLFDTDGDGYDAVLISGESVRVEYDGVYTEETHYEKQERASE